MATVVLTTLGSIFGGPLGGAVGSLIGRQIDGAIIGGPKNEGPRLKELSVSTSSYGQPIPQHYGRVRAAGTIIWSTQLKESKEKSGGGKGRPSTTSYNYSVSLAVALASRPIDGIGRIWADGNLLRGASGDLKTAGTLRIHTGHADQEVDPLLAAALGDQCPAHRGCAYAVFEDLSLADFGNRIPALSFEILAGSGERLLEGLLGKLGTASADAAPARLEGFSHDGGAVGQVLAQIDRLVPITPVYQSGALHILRNPTAAQPIPVLPQPASWSEGDFGQDDGSARGRSSPDSREVAALRYYDPERDFQPGLQRAEGTGIESGGTTLEFPGVLQAADARAMLRSSRARQGIGRETLSWRVAQLHPALAPGTLVRAPGVPGVWRIDEWEWRNAGIELHLVRHLDLDGEIATVADPGAGWRPPDRIQQPTTLRVFETPWDGSGSSESLRVYAAVSAPTGPWSGAALYASHGETLVPIGDSQGKRATVGQLVEALSPSSALRFEAGASLRLRLDDATAELATTDITGLAHGANRLLVGSEVIQFAHADPQGDGFWELSGLLRGRGGTEAAAQRGHMGGAFVVLLDDQILALDVNQPETASGSEFAAIGLVDAEPITAVRENIGASRRPPSPCHGRMEVTGEGALVLSWTRRARGGWAWLDEVEQPLVEQVELYEVGLGSHSSPARLYSVSQPRLTLEPAQLAELQAAYPGAPVWVRQSGSFGKSPALLLGQLPFPS